MTILEEMEKVKLVLEGENSLDSHVEEIPLKFKSEKDDRQMKAMIIQTQIYCLKLV